MKFLRIPLRHSWRQRFREWRIHRAIRKTPGVSCEVPGVLRHDTKLGVIYRPDLSYTGRWELRVEGSTARVVYEDGSERVLTGEATP